MKFVNNHSRNVSVYDEMGRTVVVSPWRDRGTHPEAVYVVHGKHYQQFVSAKGPLYPFPKGVDDKGDPLPAEPENPGVVDSPDGAEAPADAPVAPDEEADAEAMDPADDEDAEAEPADDDRDPADEEDEDADAPNEEADLESMKYQELKAMAKDLGILDYHRMKIEALRDAIANFEPEAGEDDDR